MELREVIASVSSSTPRQSAVKECVFLCRKIALVLLRKKLATGKMNPEFFHVSLDDLALDCIADVFQQDESGGFIQIKTYFEGLAFHTLSDEDLLTHLRRLVFSKVNQGLFQMYNEADPSLGKILRNIKLSLQSLQHFVLVERFGEQCIAPVSCETLEHLPPFERSQLETDLRAVCQGTMNIPSLLGKLSVCLREQDDCSRIVPLMTVAFIFRTLFTMEDETAVEDRRIEQQFVVDDTLKIIKQSCRRLMNETEQQYVAKKNVPRQVFVKYFEVIERNLAQRIVGQDGEVFSFFESLRSLMPELTSDEYRDQHKSRVEYLARLAYDRAVKELRKNT